MKDYIKVNKAAYDIAAKEYEERISEYEERDQGLIAPFVEYLHLKSANPHILELGPGSGLALKLLEQQRIKTTAIELSKKIIEVAAKTSPTTEFIYDDFLGYDFDGRTFDGVFAKAFVHLFPKKDVSLVFDKIYNLLNDKGVFYLSTSVHESSSEGFEKKADYGSSPERFRKRWTSEELHEALSDKWDIINESYDEERGKTWIGMTLVKHT